MGVHSGKQHASALSSVHMGSSRKMEDGGAFLTGCFLLLFVGAGCLCPPPPAAARLLPAQLWGIELDRVDPVGEVEVGHSRSDDVVLEVQAIRVTQPAARQLALEQSRVFASLFEVRRTTYPGQQTTLLNCPEEFRPIHRERALPDGSFLDAWVSWSNANRIPGACSADLAQHRTVTAQLFCASSETFLRINWSVPNDARVTDRALNFVSQLGCDSL